MRFKSKIDPKVGDRREVKKFAIFPKRIGDQIIWLENYISVQQFENYVWYYDEVVSSGIIYEKYRTVPIQDTRWREIDRKIIQTT